ncbi:MAG: hypothetical protein JF609_10895 [Verrucomicrobia bacterium]|nr:hypothetical protein [Verrucomicrobiota bacterium]
MNYDLDALTELCSERGLAFCRPTGNSLEITLAPDCILIFENLVAKNDTAAGFKETPWHFHGTLILTTDDATCVEYGELAIIQGILSGDIIILSRFLAGKLHMRWLAHKTEKIDMKYISSGEEMRIQRLF